MASRYWVGGTGTWDASSTTHWSASSGGSSGASVPTSADDVFIDSLSGTSPVITTSGSIDCLSLNFTGAITPTFTGSGSISIYGSLTFIAAMTMTQTGARNFRATSTGKTITMAGQTFGTNNVGFNGVGGGWTFQDAFNATDRTINFSDGILNTNGMTVTCGGLVISSSNVRTLTLGSSVINIAFDLSASNITNLTLTANTATINMTGANRSFTGGALTYYNVVFSGTTCTIVGSSTFTTLNLSAGKTLKLTSGTNQTVTNLIINGTVANPSTLQSVTAASAATITLPAGRYFIRHTSIKDITVSGATAVTSIAGTNVSGNTGITFVTKFEMGRIKNDGSLNWYSAATGATAKISG